MTSTGSRTTCQARRRDGQPCQSWAVLGSQFCQMHSPERAAVMAEARRRGGKARHGRKVGPVGAASPVKLASVADVLRMLEKVADDLLVLENSIARGRALIALAATWAACFESSELERRIQALEAENERSKK